MNHLSLKNKKKQYISLLSVLSAFSVVCLHTNGCFWIFSTEPYWFTANIIESIFYFAVPVFFMISGATLIDYQDRYTTKEFFIRRAKKTVIPFIIWSLIGLAYRLVKKATLIEELSFKFVINGILGTSFINIYWFFTSLFCIYLCIPLFAAVAKDKRKETFTYLALAGFLVNALFPFVINVLGVDIIWPFSISVVSGSLIYAVVGYIIDNYEFSRKETVIIYVLAIIGLLMHIVGTYCLSIEEGA